MNNPKTEEIVATLRHCATHNCIMCPAYSPPSSKCFETLAAACDRLEELEKELIDERYRHDRLQDFCVAQGEELSKLKAQQRWTPVADCPKADGQYLVTCRSFGGQWTSTLGFARVGEDVDDYDLRGKRNVWYDYDSEYGYVAVNFVTHWKPIPEAPKEV